MNENRLHLFHNLDALHICYFVYLNIFEYKFILHVVYINMLCYAMQSHFSHVRLCATP